jgi:release factor glutamine methyltransferase
VVLEIQAAGERRVLMRADYFLYNFVYKPFLKIYLRGDTSVTLDGFKVKVLKGVFHPKLFFSTQYFYEFLKSQELGASVLEIGCGTGVLSMLALKKGAKVTAIDIDSKAVKNTSINVAVNFSASPDIEIIQSDLFQNLPARTYDTILINPPYFFRKINVNAQYAWYCGENGEYFKALFSKLMTYSQPDTASYMILANNCDIERIRSIAEQNKITFKLVTQKKVKWETNFIFRLVQHDRI